MTRKRHCRSLTRFRHCKASADDPGAVLATYWAIAGTTLRRSDKVCGPAAFNHCWPCAVRNTAVAWADGAGGAHVRLAQSVSPSPRPLREASRRSRSVPLAGQRIDLLALLQKRWTTG